MMITSYLTLAIRSLQRSKSLSFINLVGLSIGLAVCLVILTYVSFELSYDRHHKNGNDIYRTILTRYINGEFRDITPLTGYGTGPALLSDVTAVKQVARAHALFGGALLSSSNANSVFQFHEERAYLVDPSFLDMFTFTTLAGDLKTALDRPNGMVITRSLANKYFGGLQALDKTLKVTGGWMDHDFTITAIVEDQPQNSSLVFDFLLPIEDLLKERQYIEDNGWGWKNFATYVQVYPGTDMEILEEKMPAFLSRYVHEKQEISFQPFFDIHTRPGLAFDSPDKVSRDKIYFYMLIAVFILFIAWGNYINLTTARAVERAKEVGVKKAIGAQRKQLMFQFLLESAIINFMAIGLGLLIATACLPLMSDIVGKELTFSFGSLRLWIFLAGLATCGTICAGLYPAFVLSAFRVTTVLKGGIEKVSNVFPVRKVLVIFQFTCSLLLISMTLVVHRQIGFMEQAVHNLNMEEILVLRAPYVMEAEGRDERLITFKNQIMQQSFVKNACTSAGIPGGGYTFTTTMRKVGDPAGNQTSGNVIWVDPDFIDTYNIEMLSGKVWEAAPLSQQKSLIINETAMSTFAIKNADEALAHKIVFENDTFAIAGVMKDYYWNSLKTASVPILFSPTRIVRHTFSIRLNTNDYHGAIAKIESLYRASFPGNPIEYHFLDSFFDQQYKSDRNFGRIFKMFALLAVLIACLGLFGLTAFMTGKRLKEISIRKVLGASRQTIVVLLLRDLLTLMLVAGVISVPLAWYATNTWLYSFAHKMVLTWDIFALPVLVLVLVCLVTVSSHIVRGANSNPAQVLKSE